MRALLPLLLLLLTVPARAQLRLPLVLSDGAVLQRGHEVPVWGWAAPGATVTVALGGDRQSAQADAAGRWRVAFAPLPVGGPYALAAESDGERVEARDLLVGDVWVLSGQSNMEWTVKDSNDAEAEIAAAGDAQIRHFKVPRSYADTPQPDLTGGIWESESPDTVGDFSAVGTFFARAVRAHHDVPIGLVNASWGGSRIEPWMSPAMLGLDAAEVETIRASRAAEVQAAVDRLRDAIGGWPETDAGLEDGVALWAATDLDDADWSTIHVPALWESEGYDGLDGVAWYRTTVTLSPADAAAGITLGLGMIDDADVTYVNGVEVGRMTAWNAERRYAVPPSALRAGSNTLAVRVVDGWGGGGIAGADDLLYVETASGARLSLVGDWRFRVAVARSSVEGRKAHEPIVLWNQMIHPLTQAPIAGVLWYQGESNGGSPEDAAAYGGLFRSMIQGWRDAWGQPDLPFYWAQLASFMAPPATPADAGLWPVVRDGQSGALALPHTAEAVLLDVGDADDIHPRDKQTVGRRLALAARQAVYGETHLVHSGPRYRSHTVEGGRVTIAFDHAESGLTTRDGAPLGGFAIAGADGAWHWADARIDGDRVTVWSAAVPEPVGVRYAWANNPEAATLTNGEGLPAAPFRTDAR